MRPARREGDLADIVSKTVSENALIVIPPDELSRKPYSMNKLQGAGEIYEQSRSTI